MKGSRNQGGEMRCYIGLFWLEWLKGRERVDNEDGGGNSNGNRGNKHAHT